MKGKFTVSAQFPVKPERLFDAWLSSREHSAMTGSPAKIDPRAGGAFSAWDGYITGTTIELHPHTRIIQSWRTSEFGAAPDSRIEITFLATKTGTKLTLSHSAIPEGQAASYKAGWTEWYFAPMQEYFAA